MEENHGNELGSDRYEFTCCTIRNILLDLSDVTTKIYRFESKLLNMYLRILFCHVFLLGFALSSPVETKESKNLVLEATTTPTPPKVSTTKNINKEQVQSISNAQTERPATKKRDVPEVLADKAEYFDDDFYEGKSTDDYDSIQALRSYLDSSRNDKPILTGKFRGNDYRYFDDESRRKRTAVFDDIFAKPDNYYEPEIQLTPEDIMALAAYKQQQRLYNHFPYGRWTDINNQIDLPEPDIESDDFYNDQPENLINRFYNQRYQNWDNLPRSDKFITNRRRRSFLGNPKLRVPIYRRAIL